MSNFRRGFFWCVFIWGLFSNCLFADNVVTESTIALENKFVRVEFDRASGTLVSIKNLVTDGECLKESGGDGNPFRLYVDTTELPKAATARFPWPHQPLEDAMGGKLVDTKNCRLVSSSYERRTVQIFILHKLFENIELKSDRTNIIAGFKLI